MRSPVILVLLAALLGLTACGAYPTPLPPTASPLPPSPTETPTIVWFPPTDTPTQLPTTTVTSTVVRPPGLGNVLFTDRFDQASLWNTAVSSQGSAVVQNGGLILTIPGSGPATILSLRSEPALNDFYAEAVIHLSLCQGKDMYGMLFRAASGGGYYRFEANCSSQVRLERNRAGLMEPLQDWLPTGDAPPGAPGQVRLGVWAVGSEMRFFLNDNFQFAAHDPTLRTGTLGFFVSASGPLPVSVTITDLTAYSVSYASPTPTPLPSRTPRPSRTPHP